ncbi:MAG: ABC transporter permease [Lachnospiraceae bacterium]|nr:ABC transporter permease [Lachnospiraceae bacterium]
MRISTIGYCLKQGLKNIWRNKMFSLASIATMSACIFLFGIFFAVVQNFQSIVKEAEEAVTMIVYFEKDTSQETMEAVGEEIKARDGVARVEFVTPEQAWDSFKGVYFAERPELADGFAEDNPLVDYAHYEVYLDDVSLQADLVVYIESLEGVRRVRASQEVADILSNFNLLVGYISISVILLLLCVSVFLISNTVTIGIAVRKEEIAIMRLIGATNSFIKAPFVVEGILIGLIGAALPLGLLYYLYNSLTSYLEEQFNLLTGFMKFLPVNELFEILLPTGMLLGVGIGFFGSFFTIRKHLRV